MTQSFNPQPDQSFLRIAQRPQPGGADGHIVTTATDDDEQIFGDGPEAVTLPRSLADPLLQHHVHLTQFLLGLGLAHGGMGAVRHSACENDFFFRPDMRNRGVHTHHANQPAKLEQGDMKKSANIEIFEAFDMLEGQGIQTHIRNRDSPPTRQKRSVIAIIAEGMKSTNGCLMLNLAS